MSGKFKKWLKEPLTKEKNLIIQMWTNWIENSRLPETSENYTNSDILNTQGFRYRRYVYHFLFAFHNWCRWVGVSPVPEIPQPSK
jgi:hypothetical protein